MAYLDPLVDIFGVSMPRTKETRLNDFHRAYSALYNTGSLNLQLSVVDLLYMVERGFLSPQSACYFLAGRASSLQLDKLKLFNRSLSVLREKGLNDFQILQSWQKTNVAVVENTFLFPLVDLDFNNVDFSEDLKELR